MTGPDPAAHLPAAVVPRRGAYVLAVLMMIFGLQYLDRQISVVLAEPLKQAFDLDDSRLGLVNGLLYAIPYAITLLPAGLLIDRGSRRNLLAAALAVWSLCTFLMGFVRNFGQLALVRVVLGAAESVNNPASLSLLSDFYDKQGRVGAAAFYFAAPALATLLGFGAIGAIAHAHGWQAAFIAASIPGFMLALILLLTVREPPRDGRVSATAEPGGAPSLAQSFRFMLAQKSLVHIFLAVTLNNFAVSAQIAWMSSLLVRVHGLTVGDAALTISIAFGLTTVIGQVSIGVTTGRMARRDITWIARVTGLCAGLSALFMAAASLVAPTALAVICLGAWSLLNGGLLGPAVGTAQSLVAPRMRGVCNAGMTLAINLIGAGFGPLIAGSLSDRFSVHAHAASIAWALAIMAAFQLWGAMHYLACGKALQQDMERADRAGRAAMQGDCDGYSCEEQVPST